MTDIQTLITQEQLPNDFSESILPHYQKLADYIAEHHSNKNQCLLVAINGAQGTGKSTLALFLQQLLSEKGKRAAVISIDDLYLTHHERQELALDVHPLFQTRGVPGTHDLELGQQIINQLINASSEEKIKIPSFNKANDDRKPEAQWPELKGPIDIILLEGWCVGAKAMPYDSLQYPTNILEKEQDPQQVWRSYINNQLASRYFDFFKQFDLLVMLKAPSFESVKEWRALQETKLAKKMQHQLENDETTKNGAEDAPLKGLMSEGALNQFMMHYERLTKHMLLDMPERADVVLELSSDHTIKRVEYKNELPTGGVYRPRRYLT